MKQANNFSRDMLDLDAPEAAHDVVWRACRPVEAHAAGGDVFFTVPFQAQVARWGLAADPETPRRAYTLRVRAYGESVVRLTAVFDSSETTLPGDKGPMLDIAATHAAQPLHVERTEAGWTVLDPAGRVRARVNTADAPIKQWSTQLPGPQETLDLCVLPDGETAVPLMAYDQFLPHQQESMVLGFVEREGVPHRAVCSLYAAPGERFAGTGERFDRIDLAGRTLTLENTDALGVNNRRAYKNVPFYVTSRPYGLFLHTSSHVRLSLADISTRAAQALVEEPAIDLFVVGGGSVERVMYNYRCLTGFPRQVPLWSYGTWMSRMSYFSEEEVRTVGRKMREGGFPCDVLHLDTGWFAKDWVCEWEFSKERFPDPEAFMKDMRKEGYRISLWQTPTIREGNKLLDLAREKRYLARRKAETAAEVCRADRLYHSRGHRVVPELAGTAAAPGSSGDQDRFRRERGPKGGLLRDAGVQAPQPLCAAVPARGVGDHPADDRRGHHLGARRVGRLPALSASLGRRLGQHVGRAGGLAARRPAPRPVGVRFLEPRRARFPRRAELYEHVAPGRRLCAVDAGRRVHLALALPRRVAARAVRIPGGGRHRAQVAQAPLCPDPVPGGAGAKGHADRPAGAAGADLSPRGRSDMLAHR
jgi:hypothetical protein